MGAGPILVDTESTGLPVLWQGGVIQYSTETGTDGTLGTLSNDEAVSMIRELIDDWKNVEIDGVSTTDLTVVEGSGLGAVDLTNMDDYFTYCPADEVCTTESPPFVMGSARTGQSPILFDDDGTMTDAVQGVGASNSILGFAGPRVVERSNGVLYITEGQAILNGKFINGVSTGSDPEVSIDDFKGVIFHELGHFIGLDHTQVNLASVIKYLNGDASEVDAIPTMLPLLVDGESQFTPHFDDKVAISLLYPSTEYTSSFCSIEGTTFESDGTTAMQGVNVVAVNSSDPLLEATSFVSGSYYTGSYADCDAPVGDYKVSGLTPGRSYTLSIEKISQAFKGGSSIEPCDPPQRDFDARTIEGSFNCDTGGTTITTGTITTSDIVTTKASTTTGDTGGSSGDSSGDSGSSSSGSSGGGCSLAR
jgi:uncharacterized membrane protein YgcG